MADEVIESFDAVRIVGCRVVASTADTKQLLVRLMSPKGPGVNLVMTPEVGKDLAALINHEAWKLDKSPHAIGVEGGQICGTTP